MKRITGEMINRNLKPKTNLNLKVMKNFKTNNPLKMQWPEKLTAHVKPKTQQKNEKPPNT